MGFKPLSEEGRLTLFKRYFPEVELTIETAERLARLDGLTPGDFKAVRMRMRFFPAVDEKVLLIALEGECVYKERTKSIGFRL